MPRQTSRKSTKKDPSLMPENMPDPANIMRLATGYWDSATLLAANALGIFGALADSRKTAEEIAAALNLDVRAAVLLLDACAALGLLAKDAADGVETYRNTPEAAAFLVPGSPGYLGGAIRWGGDQYAAWGRLAQSVQSGLPAMPPEQHLGADAEQTRRFVLGMHNRALGVARAVLHFIPLENATHLLDVGGGPGTYSVLLAQKYPSLHAVVLDLPAVVAIADELIAEAGVGDRVTTQAGNAVQDDYGTATYNAILFSGVLHQMNGATIQRMFAKARKALRPGGKVFVSDMMLDATKTQPAFSALFSLQMLLTSAEGAVFSTLECSNWLTSAGFHDITIRPLPPPLPYVLIEATAGD